MLARRTDVKHPAALTKALPGALSLVDSLTVSPYNLHEATREWDTCQDDRVLLGWNDGQ